MQRNEYLDLRNKYMPASVKLVVVAESPPATGKYFYKLPGLRSEWLFKALMELADLSPATKEQGLREFARRGWILVDATYQPLDHKLSEARRNKIIIHDYPLLLADLDQIRPDRAAPLLLVKANVCRTLERRLVQGGFNVLNRGVVLPFPSTGRQLEFWEGVRTIPEFRRC
jgi:hypothetical protein